MYIYIFLYTCNIIKYISNYVNIQICRLRLYNFENKNELDFVKINANIKIIYTYIINIYIYKYLIIYYVIILII